MSDVTKPELLIQDCDESQLLARIFPALDTNAYVEVGPGDDCAVITAPNNQFVVSTDILIEGYHFKTQWSTGSDIGWRAAMQNLSDVAAMGAVPSSVVIALGLPGHLPVSWLEDFYAGFASACRTVGAAVVGGDLSGAPCVTVAVTVHGDMQGLPPVLRTGAQPTDTVAHSGELGWAAAGLAALTAGLTAGTDVALDKAISRFVRPQPTLELGPLAARHGASAMMDLSDSLLRDCARLAQASGVEVALDLPAARQGELASGVDQDDVAGPQLEQVARLVLLAQGNRDNELQIFNLTRSWRLSGGEDHGLLATFPAGVELPEGFTIIGRVAVHDKGRPRVTVNGENAAGLDQGWDHFR